METGQMPEEEKKHGKSDASGNIPDRNINVSGPIPAYAVAVPRSTRSSDETLNRLAALESRVFEIHETTNRQLSEIKDDKSRDAVLVKRELAIIYTSSFLLIGWYVCHAVGWYICRPFVMPNEFIAFIVAGFGGGMLRLLAPYFKR